jgi:hypothetical protein
MKIKISFFVLFLVHSITAQLIFQREFSLPSANPGWYVDPIGNHYVLDNNKISKIDSLGKVMFSQAIKSQGEISQLVFNSAQKIISFSEEQQQICVFDNTITPVSMCLNLDEFTISNATLIASSSRANCIWIFDRVNSTVLLLDTEKKILLQRLRNLSGLIGLSNNITFMREDDEKLWISDGKKTYCFDLNLNLVETHDFQCVSSRLNTSNNQTNWTTSFIALNTYFEFQQDVLFVLNLDSKDQGIGENPVPDAENIYYSNGNFYFKKGSKVFVYKIA